jgi:hypothetical protein
MSTVRLTPRANRLSSVHMVERTVRSFTHSAARARRKPAGLDAGSVLGMAGMDVGIGVCA